MCLAVADDVLHVEVCHFGCDGANWSCPARGRKGTKKERRGFPLRSVKFGLGRNLVFFVAAVGCDESAGTVNMCHERAGDVVMTLLFEDFACSAVVQKQDVHALLERVDALAVWTQNPFN